MEDVYYVNADPVAQDIDRFTYMHQPIVNNFKLIVLPDLFISYKSYLETRYPTIPIKVVPHSIDTLQWPAHKEQSKKLNLFIRASNTSFYESSWRQLCIAERLFHMTPDSLNEVYLFNTPSNSCAVAMYENLEICKKNKLRTFIDFEPAQIVQYFSNQPFRAIYLMNSVAENVDKLALYSLQNKLGVVHTSKYMKQNNLGIYYNSYDIDAAIVALSNNLSQN